MTPKQPSDRLSPLTSTTADQRVMVFVPEFQGNAPNPLPAVIERLGATLPEPENDRLAALTGEVLGAAEIDAQGWESVGEGWLETPEAQALVVAATEALTEAFGDAPLCALSDPQLSPALPFWRRVLEGMDQRAVLIHELATPGDLQGRDDMHPARSALIWLRMMLRTERAGRGLSRALVARAPLLRGRTQPLLAAQQALGLAWPRPRARGIRSAQAQDAAKIPLPDLISEWPEQVSRIFTRWAEQGEDAGDYPELDRIAQALSETGGMVEALVEMLEEGADDALLRTELEVQARDIAQLRTQSKQRETRIKALELELEAARADAAAQSEVAESRQVEALREELTDVTDVTNALQDALSDMRRRAGRSASRLDELEGVQKRYEQSVGELRETRAELESQKSALTTLEEERSALTGTLSVTQDKLYAAQEQALALDVAQAELDQLKKSFVARSVDLASSRRSSDELGEMLRVTEAELQEARSGGETVRADLDQALREIQEKAQALDVAQAELADLGNTLSTREAELQEARSSGETVRADLDQALHEAQETALALDVAQAELAKLRNTLSAREAELNGNKLKREELEEALRAREDAVAEAREDARKAEDDLIQTRSALRQRQHEAEQATEDLVGEKRRNAALDTEISELRVALDTMTGAHEEEMLSQEVRLVELEAERAVLGNRVEEGFDEVATLSQFLRQAQEDAATRAQTQANLEAEIGTLAQRLKHSEDLGAQINARLKEQALATEQARTQASELEGRLKHSEVLGAQVNARLKEQTEATEQARTQVSELEGRLKHSEDLGAQINAQLKEQTEATEQARNQAAQLNTRLREQAETNQTETVRLQAEHSALRDALALQIWNLTQVLLAQAERPFLPARTVQRRQVALLRAAGVLDEGWYLEANPDLAQAGWTDAAAHFVQFGRAEKRPPNGIVAQAAAGA